MATFLESTLMHRLAREQGSSKNQQMLDVTQIMWWFDNFDVIHIYNEKISQILLHYGISLMENSYFS